MKYVLCFLIGFSLAPFMYGPDAKERGFYVGKWVRENILKLPPITSEDYHP